MYGGGTPWGYINAKNRADRAEGEASSAKHELTTFQSKFSIWFGEETNLIRCLNSELQKANPNIIKIKKISGDLERYIQEGNGLLS